MLIAAMMAAAAATNVYMGVQQNNPASWAVAVFCGLVSLILAIDSSARNIRV